MAARFQARHALGRDADAPDLFSAPPKAPTPLRAPEPRPSMPDPYAVVEHVLSIGEAAMSLAVSRSELEAMIANGKVEALPTDFTRMIPTKEIDRLQKVRSLWR